MKGRQPKALVGSSGMTELLYSGSASGTVSWWGAVTGTQYKAGLKRPRIYVDNQDVEKALSDWKEQDRTVFSRAPIAKPPKPVQLPPEPKPIIEVDDIPFCDEPEEIDEQVLPDEPERQVEVDATNGALELAEEHGIDLSELYDGKKLTVYDVRKYIESNTFDS